MWGWITELIGKFFDKAREVGAGLVGRVMTTLGVSWTSIEYAVPQMIGWLQSHAGGAAADVISVLAYIRIPEAMSMIISAYAIRLGMKVMLSPLSVLGRAGATQS